MRETLRLGSTVARLELKGIDGSLRKAGPHTCYNGNYNQKQGCKAERIRKDCLSLDCSLQLGNMKLSLTLNT